MLIKTFPMPMNSDIDQKPVFFVSSFQKRSQFSEHFAQRRKLGMPGLVSVIDINQSFE